MFEKLNKINQRPKPFEVYTAEHLWNDRYISKKMLECHLNEDIDQVAEDFQNLLEKFEDNKALSQETLEKMERIRELMEDISNEQLQEALEKMRESLEQLDPDVLKKAMEDFKFSMVVGRLEKLRPIICNSLK